MPDNINIENLEAGRNACDSIKGAAQNVQTTGQSAGDGFKPLTSLDPDLGTHFINELKTSFEDIATFLGSINLESYFQGETDADAGDAGNGGYGGGGYGGGGYGGGGYGGATSTEVEPAVPSEPSVTTPQTTPHTKPPTDIDVSSLEKMELSNLLGLMIELKKLYDPKKETLDEFLANDENSDKIKKMVLNSPYVPKKLKEILMKEDSKVVRKLLKNILNGKHPEIFALDDVNKAAMVKYLKSVAERKNMSYEDLLKDEKLLKETMAELDDVADLVKGWEKLSPEKFQEQLKSFYYGDVSKEFPDQDIYVTRSFVDYLSNECDVSYDELLTDNRYAKTLKEGAQSFGKALTFFSTTSSFSDNKMASLVTDTLKGVTVKNAPKNTATETPQNNTSIGENNNTNNDDIPNNFGGSSQDSQTNS